MNQRLVSLLPNQNAKNQNFSLTLELVLTTNHGFASIYSSLCFLEFHRLVFLVIIEV